MFKKLFGTVVTVFKLYMYFYQTFLNLFYHYFYLSIIKKKEKIVDNIYHRSSTIN